MKQLLVREAPNGFNTLAIHGGDTINVKVVGTTASTETVPSLARYVLFSANKDFYVRWDGSAAAVPGANVTNGTGSELNPTIRSVEAGETFSVVGSAAGTVVTLTYYS